MKLFIKIVKIQFILLLRMLYRLFLQKPVLLGEKIC